MNDFPLVKVCKARGELRDPETHDLFGYVTLALEVDCEEYECKGPVGEDRDAQRRSPPSMRSSTKKQFSSSWNA